MKTDTLPAMGMHTCARTTPRVFLALPPQLLVSFWQSMGASCMARECPETRPSLESPPPSRLSVWTVGCKHIVRVVLTIVKALSLWKFASRRAGPWPATTADQTVLIRESCTVHAALHLPQEKAVSPDLLRETTPQ